MAIYQEDADIKVRAAWLHSVGGRKRSDVAACLEVSSIKTHRLIACAVSDGTVTISIAGEIAACLRLEARSLVSA